MKHGTIKPVGNVGLIPCLQSSQQPHQVSKEGHFLAGAKPQDILRTSWRGIRQILQALQACLMASIWLGFWPGEATKSSTRTFIIKGSSKANFKRSSWSITILAEPALLRLGLFYKCKCIGFNLAISGKEGFLETTTMFQRCTVMDVKFYLWLSLNVCCLPRLDNLR